MQILKFSKKIKTTIIASVVTVCSASSIIANASDPKIYVKIVPIDDNTVRADVMLRDWPEIASVGFHLNFGDGLDFIDHDFDTVRTDSNGTTSRCFSLISDYKDNDVFITGGTARGNLDINGCFISIYAEKTASYSEDTVTITPYFRIGDIMASKDSINYLDEYGFEYADIEDINCEYEIIKEDLESDAIIINEDLIQDESIIETEN